MYLIGIIFYIGVVSLYFLFDSIKFLVHEAVQLAPEISVIIAIIALYPVAIFFWHVLFRMRDAKYGRYLASQAKLSASVSVSFGLIGTFQGLTQMVSTISQAMGSGSKDADLVERMNVMIDSISSALASMSYAFITSICGVAASVLILIALNFLLNFYKKEEKLDTATTPDTNSAELINRDYSEDIEKLIIKVSQVEELNLAVASKLVGLPAIEEDSGKVISLLSDVKGNLSNTLHDMSLLNDKQMEIQQAIVSSLNSLNTVIQENTEKYMTEINLIVGDQKSTFASISASIDRVNETLSASIDRVNETLEKTFVYTQQLPELINKHNKVNEILMEVKNDVSNGLHLLSNDVCLIPDLLHSQNTSNNILVEMQQGFAENMKENSAQLQELIEIQKSNKLSSQKVKQRLKEALEIFSND